MADISKISPDNGTTIYNLKDIEARKRVPEVLLKDTVGWTGKNLLKIPANVVTQTINGVTFTVNRNSDGEVTSIVANGTATADTYYASAEANKISIKSGVYKASCGVVGNWNTYGMYIKNWTDNSSAMIDSNEKSITFENDKEISVVILVKNGQTLNNVTFYPMLRDASILDSTYEPYHESVEEVVGDIRAGQAVLGAKNQIYYPYYSSYTTDWIDDGDGKVKLNGTISSRITFVLIHRSQPHNVPSGKYILSKGFVSSDVGYSCGAVIEAYNNDTWVKNLASSDGTDEITFDIDYNGYNKINVYLFATAGTYSNLVFKPMLRLASDPDDTYVPYAMTNRELTEKKINLSDLKTVVSASSDFANFQTRIASL